MAKRYICCTVDDEYVRVRGGGIVVGAAGSHDDVVLRLTFSALCEGTTKRIVWFDALGKNPTLTVLTTDLLAGGDTDVYDVPVPAAAKAVEGDMRMTIRGVILDGDGNEESATLSAEALFRVLPSRWDPYAGESRDITPSQAEQLQSQIDGIRSDIVAAAEAADAKAAAGASALAALARADDAGRSANEAEDGAALSQSWAVGGTGTREGEDVDNAKYWIEQARAAAGGGVVSFNRRTGAVLPARGDYSADDVGAAASAGIASVETGSAAASAHAAGTYISWGGLFYRVRAAIAASDTLAVGTNLALTTVAEVLEAVHTSLAKNAEDIAALTPLAADLTLYVNADTGNRDNDGLTPETPLNTISLALSKAPKNLNGHTLTIRLAAGTYDESVSVAGFYGGKLQNRGSIIITGALESGARLSTVKNIANMSTGACVLLHNLTITGTVSISGGAAMQAMGLRITGDGTGVGVLCEQGIGNFMECFISNKNIAVQATMGGIIFLSGYAVYSGNAIGLQSTAAGNQYPGIILSQYQVTGTTDNVKGAGAISVGGTWL